jgi:PPOX class probable F420-dependent enzyme
LDEAEARRRVGAARVATLGTIGPGGRVDLVPVTFAVHGDRLVTAVDHKPKSTTRLQRLINVEADPRVTVLVDAYDEDWDALWWVRVRGHGRVVTSGTDHASAVALLTDKYDAYVDRPPAGRVVDVDLSSWRWWSASG